jgi:hypothetical protein
LLRSWEPLAATGRGGEQVTRGVGGAYLKNADQPASTHILVVLAVKAKSMMQNGNGMSN